MPVTPPPSAPAPTDIAIVGMACLFPGAADLRAYWQNILDKVDAVGDPPRDWESDLYLDASSPSNDRVYTARGGYLGDLARFDPLQYGIMPNSVDGGEPDQFLALRVAHAALTDAGYLDRIADRTRAEVIIGRGTYINRGFTTVVQHGVIVDQVLRVLRQLHPEHDDAELAAIKQQLKASLPPFTAEVAPALVPNVMSGRIANRLDFMGANYTVDAACASSLIAVDHGMRDLIEGRCDVALVGGVHGSTPAPILMIFCQLNALSRRGQIRPFDRGADGTLLGEGVGFVVLKRLADAERDGDRIYAVLKGIGVASDGRALGLLAPRVEGEVLALRRAYEQSGIDPKTVGLIEAHGTGTLVGDLTEVQALREVFGARRSVVPSCAVGTVKSMISHLIPAAGIAGLIKASLSLHHAVLPPTLHCDEVNPAFELEKTPFYINTSSRPWIHGAPTPRRAGVNAFGFGGINAHAVLEEHGASAPAPDLHYDRWDSEVCVLEAQTRSALASRAAQVAASIAGGGDLKNVAFSLNTSLAGQPYRLALVATSCDDLVRKLEASAEKLRNPGCRRIRDANGAYYTETPLRREGLTAFMFPGEGSQYVNMLADLCMCFPELREWYDLVDRAFANHPRGYAPSDAVFPPPGCAADEASAEDRLWRMDCGPEVIFAANQGLHTLLRMLDVRADVVVGHSTGEYSALHAAGAIDASGAELLDDILALNRLYEASLTSGEIPTGVLLTVGAADQAVVRSVAADLRGEVYVAMDNCPHQVVLCGSDAAIAEAAARLRVAGAVCERLPFDRAYHTPLFGAFCGRLGNFFEQLRMRTPDIPLYSCATARRMPHDLAAIRRIASTQWGEPVRFRETVERMHTDGVRVFIEVGPRNNLTSFVSNILRGRSHLVVPVNVPGRSGMLQLHHALAQLAANHVPVRFDRLYSQRRTRRLTFDNDGRDDGAARDTGEVALRCGLQPLRLPPVYAAARTRPDSGPASTASSPGVIPPPQVAVPLPAPVAVPIPAPAASADGDRARVLTEYFATMDQFLSVQQMAMQTFLQVANVTGPPHQPAAAASAAAATMTAATESRPDVSAAAVTASPPRLADVLLNIVSDRTGYPLEMLDPALDLEGDLGIDSIRRVEILTAFQQQTGRTGAGELELLTRQKTLAQMLRVIEGGESAAGASAPAAPVLETRPRSGVIADLPFIGEVLRHTHDVELVVTRNLDLGRDLFLSDHTLGRQVSEADATLRGLPVVPLTISMEMLAEVALALCPELVVVGMTDVRASRWIGVDTGRVRLRLEARRKAVGPPCEVLARILAYGAEEGPLVEGTVLLATGYPERLPIEQRHESRDEPSAWSRDGLYSSLMFHGPGLQGVASVDTTGPAGSRGTLRNPPERLLFSEVPAPRFLIDPVLLDAAGQLVGYWTAEHFQQSFHVFPFKVEGLAVYGPPVPAGVPVRCEVRSQLIGDAHVRSDLDMVTPDGRLQARLRGWWDRRFDLPDAFYRLRISPRDVMLGEPWRPPVAIGDADGQWAGCRVGDVDPDFLAGSGAIWLRVLAHLVLSRRERDLWQQLRTPLHSRIDWLLGRVAAKDAVRMLLQPQEVRVCPADIEIENDGAGCPHVRIVAPGSTVPAPRVSISHCRGQAVAIAADSRWCAGVGVDVERMRALEPGFASTVLTPAEQELLAPAGEAAADWMLRVWCAKEAAGKATQRGLSAGPRAFTVTRVDRHTGAVEITPPPGDDAGGSAPAPIMVCTAVDAGVVVATAMVLAALPPRQDTSSRVTPA